MKKKQKIKELKVHNLELQNRFNVANLDCDVWESKCKDLESLESGFIKIGVKDYDMLLDSANAKIQPNLENRDNERYEKNRESQLFTAEYYRRGEEIEKLNHSNVFWQKEYSKLTTALIETNLEKERFESENEKLKAENNRLSNLLEPNYLQGKNEDRPCTEKEKSFCADCGLACRKK
jgi:septal ring factor EnvC (AmiA/AmiB activator)